MPEENKPADLMRTLDLLEDPMLNPLARGQCYKTFIAALDSNVEISTSVIDRLLALCVDDLENDKKSLINVMKMIQSILKRIETCGLTDLPSLLSSISSVLNIIKTSALMSKVETMQTMCFDILLLYPNETLIEIATLYTSEVTEVLNLYCHHQIPVEVRILPCGLIMKLLKILPPEKKAAFVKENLSIWFSKVIPAIILSVGNMAGNDSPNLNPLETLESLTEELAPIDYADNAKWLDLLECIHNPKNYPAIMRNMLVNNSNKWHRLWIVFIKLLKHQITKTTFSQASPINSMLPVVEQAFKMDVTNRCRAFQCWDVLIDNFRMESNEAYIVKRLKLLIIPLKSNNAKVEETAIAKLNTWWHLIRSYQTKLDKFVDKVLISFLHFCFGRHVGMSPKSSLVPGLLSVNTKRKTFQTFIEMAGHLCCSGCVDVPKLNNRILSTTILVEYWSDWVYSLKMAINILNGDVGLPMQQLECLWKSYIMTIAEMPDNNIRKDLFNELLAVLENCVKVPETNSTLPAIVFHLLTSLFDEEKFRVLFKARDEHGPFNKIVMMLLSPSLTSFYRSGDSSGIVKKLRILSNYFMKLRMLLPCLLNCPAQHNNSFLLTAIAETLCEAKPEEVVDFIDFMMWPLKAGNVFTDSEYSTRVWVSLVNYIYPKVKATVKDKLRAAISRDINQSNTNLKLHLCIAILNTDLTNDSVSGCTKNVELLMAVTNKLDDYKYVNDNLTMLTDTVNSTVNKIKNDTYSGLLKNALTIIRNLLKFMHHILNGANETDFKNKPSYEKLLKCVENVIKNNSNCPSITIVVDELLNCATNLHNHPSIQNKVIDILKLFLSSKNDDLPILLKVKDTIASLETKIMSGEQNEHLPIEDKFAAPETKTVTKKVKRKETKIVNTVVENGEEYEVIKSNWKFNPRKLTENQKEKLQRKREDIPALYQDLSQSQDEFKLSTWKADSQDSSSTNSRSTTNSKSISGGNVSEILKNIPSSDVVPKIIENIFSEKKDNDINAEDKPANDTTKKLKQTMSKDPKSPRMALKDRVFRNVRNLIEKSSVQKEAKDLSESLIQVENMPKTPSSKQVDIMQLINSAPPNLGPERPSRLKRKPKKFDDVQIFSLKKSRRSSSLNDSQADSQMECQQSEGSAQDQNSPMSMEVESDDKSDSNESTKLVPSEKFTKNVDVKSEETITHASVEEPIEPVINKEMLPETAEIEKEKVELNKESSLAPNTHSLENQDSISVIHNKQVDIVKDLSAVTTTASGENDVNLESTTEATISNVSEDVKELPTNETAIVKSPEDDKIDSLSVDKSDNTVVSAKNNTKTITTPKYTRKQEMIESRSGKRNSARKSRIEKELAIDTVEGHPFLKIQTEKRITRKNLNSPLNNSRRKSLTEKLSKSKVEAKTPLKTQASCSKKKEKEVTSSDTENLPVTVGESQEKCSENSDDLPYSEDVIESSQDSTFTTISVKSSKPALKKVTVVVQKHPLPTSVDNASEITRDDLSIDKSLEGDSKDDTELPQNKTAQITTTEDKSDFDLTETMDTQPVDSKVIEEIQNSSEVIIINDDEEPIVISAESQEIANADTQPTAPSDETQEIADADTQPTSCSSEAQEIAEADTQSNFKEIGLKSLAKSVIRIAEDDEIQISNVTNTEDEITSTVNKSINSTKAQDDNTASSPFKDEEQRKKDFLDNTLEISPIKTMSPMRDKKSPSPETSSDYVLIKLSSPVQSNGEPFEKCDSPEIFTEDKVSPDKRDLSPPRQEAAVSNTSPSSSLSLKKNRPQVRSGGRAAQMLGLCVPDRLQTIMNSERSEPEEPKKNSPSSTPARRNLRILYSSVGGDSNENSEENEDSETFLKFKRALPTSDCSPAGPILKRKLAEITDDATVSPASKRKRVSFHDPPVSTTVAVQKYIEPCGIRSPQNSAIKRQERQNLRAQTVLSKSPKRLDNVFKLDTVLTKAVESFTEPEQSSPEITQTMSLDETPAVEIIKTSDLNNVDPICPELVDCKDPIDNIAAELSSATMKTMLLKELEGKISTIGDLAKMTELEVNRLCIKAPKVKVAQKVLSDYASKRAPVKDCAPMETVEIMDDEVIDEKSVVDKADIEVQTNKLVTNDIEMQTAPLPMTDTFAQTDKSTLVHIMVQTDESSFMTTREVISSCLEKRPDFVDDLCENLEESSKQRIAENLPTNIVTDIFMENVTSANSRDLINRILQKQNASSSSKGQCERDLSYLKDYMCDRFDNKDLILFCSQLLAKIHSKPL